MADTNLWSDLRTPYQIVDFASITPTTTQKMLWTPGSANPMGNFPANYWNVGKAVQLTARFKWTSGTAGNWAVGMAYGAADAAAVNVVSATHAAIASVGPFVVAFYGVARCVTIPTPTTATLSMSGYALFPVELMLSTVGNVMPFPNAGTTVVSTFDNSLSTNGLYFQALRSAGTDTVVCIGAEMVALN